MEKLLGLVVVDMQNLSWQISLKMKDVLVQGKNQNVIVIVVMVAIFIDIIYEKSLKKI